MKFKKKEPGCGGWPAEMVRALFDLNSIRNRRARAHTHTRSLQFGIRSFCAIFVFSFALHNVAAAADDEMFHGEVAGSERNIFFALGPTSDCLRTAVSFETTLALVCQLPLLHIAFVRVPIVVEINTFQVFKMPAFPMDTSAPTVSYARIFSFYPKLFGFQRDYDIKKNMVWPP